MNGNISTDSMKLTTPHIDDNLLAMFKDLGLDAANSVHLINMIEREEILAKYDFDNIKPDAKGQYRIWVKDPLSSKNKTRLYGKNLDILKEKVYRYVKNLPDSNKAITFGYAFEQAQKFEEENTQNENHKGRRY